MITGHISVAVPVSLRFGNPGWNVTYEVDGWLGEVFDQIGQQHDLGNRYENATWVNGLNGQGAEVGEHDEGFADDDITVVLFLSNLEDEEGGALVVEQQRICPEIGKYVIFSSKARHSVEPLRVDKTRLTAAAIFHA